MAKKSGKALRSAHWFGGGGKDGMIHRSWMKNQGLPHHLFDGRPVIGICNSWSELTPCNAHFRDLADHFKRGYVKLYVDHVQQANRGADFDFLVGASGSGVRRESH